MTPQCRNPYGFTASYVADLIVDYYQAHPTNGVGGYLHVVLDDDNIETSHIEWCIEQAATRAMVDWPAIETCGMSVILGWILLQLTRTQRGKAIRLSIERGRYDPPKRMPTDEEWWALVEDQVELPTAELPPILHVPADQIAGLTRADVNRMLGFGPDRPLPASGVLLIPTELDGPHTLD